MADRLVVGVLGGRNSGKSTTWNTLLGAAEEGGSVRTGKYERWLYLNAAERVNVFVVSGSPEERERFVGDILRNETPAIVLCSMQYREDVRGTIDFFADNGYDFYVVWLNPGYHDEKRYADDLGLIDHLLRKDAIVSQRSGKDDPNKRCLEMRQFMYGWAKVRNLITIEFN